MNKSNFTPLLDRMIVLEFEKNREFKKPIIQACVTSTKIVKIFKKPISGRQVLNRYYKIRNRYEKI
jgi:hypothetical protein